MGTGYMNQRAAGGLAHLHDIHLDVVALGEVLAGDLLGGGQQCLGGIVALANFYNNITGGGHDPGNGAGEQLLGFAGIALEHHAPLCLADALNHHLLGGLGSNAAKLGNVHGNVDGIALLGIGLIVPGCIDGNFQRPILRLCHSGLDLEHGQAVFVQVYHHVVGGQNPMVFPVAAVGVDERLLQPFHHIIHGDALELLQITKTFKNFGADVHLGCFGLFLGSGSSCHVYPPQNSTRSRTSATWDFSNVTVSLPTSAVTLPSS